MQKENNAPVENHQYVGPYRLEKTLGKGQTGELFIFVLIVIIPSDLKKINVI